MTTELGSCISFLSVGSPKLTVYLDVTSKYADPQTVGHMQAALSETGWLRLSLGSASKRCHSLPSAGTTALRRAQLITRHPRGGKLWVPRIGRQRLYRPGGGKHRRWGGRVILGDERCRQRTVFPSKLRDHPRRDLTPSTPVQTGTEEPPGC